MAVLAPNITGGAVAYVAASGGGDSFANSGGQRLHVRNGGGGSITVTFVASGQCNQGFTHDLAYTVGAGLDKLLPALPVDRFGTTVSVTYSGVSSVTVGVIST